MQMDATERRPYAAPALRVYGGIAALTQDPPGGVKPNVGTDCSPFAGSSGKADCS